MNVGFGGDPVQFITSSFKRKADCLPRFSDEKAEGYVFPKVTSIHLWTELEPKHVSVLLPEFIVFPLQTSKNLAFCFSTISLSCFRASHKCILKILLLGGCSEDSHKIEQILKNDYLIKLLILKNYFYILIFYLLANIGLLFEVCMSESC